MVLTAALFSRQGGRQAGAHMVSSGGPSTSRRLYSRSVLARRSSTFDPSLFTVRAISGPAGANTLGEQPESRQPCTPGFRHALALPLCIEANPRSETQREAESEAIPPAQQRTQHGGSFVRHRPMMTLKGSQALAQAGSFPKYPHSFRCIFRK